MPGDGEVSGHQGRAPGFKGHFLSQGRGGQWVTLWMSEAEVPIGAGEGHRMLSLGFFNFSIVRRSFLFDFFFYYY